MNVEVGAEAALFPVKEYIKEIFVAVQKALRLNMGVFSHLFASQRKMPGDSRFVVAHLPDGRSFIVMLFSLKGV
jgi:hypothetical protein